MIPKADGSVVCPVCKRTRLLRVTPDGGGHGLILYCKRCRREVFLNIEEPEPKSQSPGQSTED